MRKGELGTQGLLKKIDVIDDRLLRPIGSVMLTMGPNCLKTFAHDSGEKADQRLGKTLVKHPPGVTAWRN